ncbi:lipopolysaccharide biosynthesis protein [Seonamhaeicola sediminis]|uniref:lipopolysaccharide biosynthesis protein n=1 Tax=Seonamhaeicola sediminis TaxID=2528206 RepID=UPI001644DF66|nr:oligosaccharide flippase family protein [Seonamhaeicola sediminis]
MSLKLKYKLEYNFIIYLIGKVTSAGVVVGSIPLFIKCFGVEEYGEFIYVYTTFLMLLAGSTGWIVQGVLRFFTLENNRGKISSEAFQMTYKSFLVSALLLSVFFLISEIHFNVIFLTVGCLFFSFFYSVNLSIKQAVLKSKVYIFADISRALTFLVVPLLMYYFLPTLEGIYSLLFGVLLSYIVGLCVLTRCHLPKPNLNFKEKTRWSKIFFKYGFPLSIWMFFSPTTNGVDRYIIEFSLGTIVLAKYSAIFDIVFKVFSSLAVPFNSIVQPLLILNYNEKNFAGYKKTMRKSITYLSIMFILFLGGLYLFKNFIICTYLNFCVDFEKLEKLIIPFAVSSYIWQLAILMQKNMEVSNRTIETSVYMLIIVVLTLLLGIILVPRYGMFASAYISLLCSVVYLILIVFGTKKHFKQ